MPVLGYFKKYVIEASIARYAFVVESANELESMQVLIERHEIHCCPKAERRLKQELLTNLYKA